MPVVRAAGNLTLEQETRGVEESGRLDVERKPHLFPTGRSFVFTAVFCLYDELIVPLQSPLCGVCECILIVDL